MTSLQNKNHPYFSLPYPEAAFLADRLGKYDYMIMEYKTEGIEYPVPGEDQMLILAALRFLAKNFREET